ncbi:hypothetical protein FOQG_07489 [Fusarium oxysporum f. sp. raphani 54005]|uniref:Uncharacterized protein n=10 Tax=Fusarium oxysporum TaxID=5507 RepID=A0A420S743_FUSOX|nr:hypothetical protein FOXG_17829 [Fusarium oxysporum f. sp. lycopersici 4287]EWZ50226.1 hypothetical protein FOZG_00856 [Fusarium oxysporum Fo47]EWZ92305.1 hypothetical protein FOWG_07475 [Fusarium oxysporum f. sp. lycopersici MN25]EXA53548.1 hypothetical protein FOVG_01325 [Fusarium oxysporum f. sp. pisi HDV247]EXK47472.1 hypothetical protein FOMG_00858 [Fusarium oxysporum f. sp. melonis 26406]EXK90120.1 hypothetical protein FOQG_07489 [Fusarium oxysporum f. sp. raphani 54005]EXL49186.1 hy
MGVAASLALFQTQVAPDHARGLNRQTVSVGEKGAPQKKAPDGNFCVATD